MKIESAILQMFYGQRGTQDSVRPTEKYAQLENKVLESERALMEKLSAFPELIALHQKYIEDLSELYDEEIEMHYAEGFRFGCLIGLDIMKS